MIINKGIDINGIDYVEFFSDALNKNIRIYNPKDASELRLASDNGKMSIELTMRNGCNQVWNLARGLSTETLGLICDEYRNALQFVVS